MKTVVIGGGIAGLLAAKKLGATLITDQQDFVFLPRLPELLRDEHPSATIPIEDCHDDIILGHADTNLEEQEVRVNDETIAYDQLVIATGATPVGPIPGQKTYAHTLYTHEDALKLKHEGHNNRVVIIGAGPTGVELAMELADDNDVKLIQRNNHILPTFSDKTRRYAQKTLIDAGVKLLLEQSVTRINSKYVVSEHDKHRYDIVIWTAGVHAKPPKSIDAPKGIPVNDYLQVQGYDNVWAIGDCAATKAPLTAQAAQQEALHAARNIARKHKGKPLKKYSFHNKGDFLLLGDKAVMDSFITLTGALPALIRYLYYQLQLRRYRL